MSRPQSTSMMAYQPSPQSNPQHIAVVDGLPRRSAKISGYFLQRASSSSGLILYLCVSTQHRPNQTDVVLARTTVSRIYHTENCTGLATRLSNCRRGIECPHRSASIEYATERVDRERRYGAVLYTSTSSMMSTAHVAIRTASSRSRTSDCHETLQERTIEMPWCYFARYSRTNDSNVVLHSTTDERFSRNNAITSSGVRSGCLRSSAIAATSAERLSPA